MPMGHAYAYHPMVWIRIQVPGGREVKLIFSFVAKNYLYFVPERCDHKTLVAV